MTKKILFFKNSEIDKILKLKIKDIYKAEILASICRLNTLSIIKRAGSGHIGTSFSAMDIFVWVKFFKFKATQYLWPKNGKITCNS